MKILILARNYPKPKDPLGGIFEFDQAKALQASGHEVIVVAVDLRSLRRRRRLFKYWVNLEGVNILNLSIPLGALPIKLLTFFAGNAIKWYYDEIVAKFGRPDIIHAHFYLLGAIGSVLKQKYKIPLVITEHSSLVNKAYLNDKTKWDLKIAYKHANQVVVVSNILKRRLQNHLGIEAVVIPNIVDTEIFHFEEKPISNIFNFLTVAQLDENKSVGLLIDAFIDAEFDSNVHLKIIGDGPLYNELFAKIKHAKVKSQIELLGKKTRKEMVSYFTNSNTFVLPSKSETFGVVYIEALLCGLPVIATSCGGPEDFVNDKNGLLIPVDNKEELINALKMIKKNDYDKKLISENCRQKFAPEIIANRITKLYEQVLLNENETN